MHREERRGSGAPAAVSSQARTTAALECVFTSTSRAGSYGCKARAAGNGRSRFITRSHRTSRVLRDPRPLSVQAVFVGVQGYRLHHTQLGRGPCSGATRVMDSHVAHRPRLF